MSQNRPVIEAQNRERTGSRYSARLRSEGRLPAVVYGHGAPPIAVSVPAKEMLAHLHHGVHLVDLKTDGGVTETCLVKDLQFGWLGDNVIHMDFTRVNLNEEVTVNVHLTFVGEPAAAKEAGAVVNHHRTELSVTCIASAIPDGIEINLGEMEGDSLSAGQIAMPAGVVLADEPDTLVVAVGYVAEEAVGEEAEVEGGAEPEVLTESAEDKGDD